MPSDGMHCYDCETTHTEWEDAGSHAVQNGMYSGIVERWRCGNCESITEGVRR